MATNLGQSRPVSAASRDGSDEASLVPDAVGQPYKYKYVQICMIFKYERIYNVYT